MGPLGKDLLPQEYVYSEHVVVWYFDQQMTFEDEDALRKAGDVRTQWIMA